MQLHRTQKMQSEFLSVNGRLMWKQLVANSIYMNLLILNK